jgi:hypothetical protein
MLSVTYTVSFMLNVIYEPFCAECRNDEYFYDECHYAECRSADESTSIYNAV